MCRVLEPFARDERGVVAVLFAFALVPLIGFMGMAIDYGRAASTRAALQQAVDAAALAAMRISNESAAQRPVIATNLFMTNKPAALDAVPVVEVTSTQAVVSASATLPTTFMGVLGFASTPISVEAVAVKVFDGLPPCILALNKSASPGIAIAGNSSFTGEDCVLHANSSASGAIDIGGSASVKAGGYCAVGSVITSVPLTPSPQNGCDELPDPYAQLEAPITTGCDYNNKIVNSVKHTTTLEPGVYCGGLDIKTDTILNPGLYVISDGALIMNAQGSVTGEGVTFYLIGSNPAFDINGGAKLELSAMTSGPYSGLLVVQNRNSNVGATSKINGNSSTTLVGAIYAPTQGLALNGNGTFGQRSPYMPIIADTVKVTGNNTTMVEVDPTVVNPIAPLPKQGSGIRLVR